VEESTEKLHLAQLKNEKRLRDIQLREAQKLQNAQLRTEQQFLKEQQEAEKKLRHSDFRNFALEKALFHMRENPNDIGAFRKAFRGSTAEYPIPEEDAAAYGVIRNEVEDDFFRKIEENRARPLEEAEKSLLKNEKQVRQSKFQTIADRAALEAYMENPENLDAFIAGYLGRMKGPLSGQGIPKEEVGDFMEISDRSQRSYYKNIETNKKNRKEKAQELKLKNEKELRHSEFENFVLRQAMAEERENKVRRRAGSAEGRNEDSLGDFHNKLQERIKDYPIPPDEAAEYALIVSKIEGQSFKRLEENRFKSIEEARQSEEENELTIGLSEYHNLALRTAMEAAKLYPNNLGKFLDYYRSEMGRFGTPALYWNDPEEHLGKFHSIANQVEAQFYQTIEGNRKREKREAQELQIKNEREVRQSEYKSAVDVAATIAYENHREDPEGFLTEFNEYLAAQSIPEEEVGDYAKISERAKRSFFEKTLENRANSIERAQQNRVANEKMLRLSNFKTAAQREAVQAYDQNRANQSGFDATFAKRMEAYPIPLDDAEEYGKILNEEKSRFFLTIANNEEKERLEAQKYSGLRAANGYFENGVRVNDGEILSLNPAQVVYENFTRATGLLMSTTADGRQLFKPEEIADITDGWTLQILQGKQAVDLNGNISLEALARLDDPNFDYAVTVPNPSGGELIFRASDLSPERRNRFNAESVERVAALLQKESDGAALDHSQKIWRSEEKFIPGNSIDRESLELLAKVQLADNPVGEKNLKQHLDNAFRYAAPGPINWQETLRERFPTTPPRVRTAKTTTGGSTRSAMPAVTRRGFLAGHPAGRALCGPWQTTTRTNWTARPSPPILWPTLCLTWAHFWGNPQPLALSPSPFPSSGDSRTAWLRWRADP
jgi:hypothetical protein